jgi:hypothetical protein
MNSKGRGGKRTGAGRKPNSHEIHAIIDACNSVRAWFAKRQEARALRAYWSQPQFGDRPSLLAHHRAIMETWSLNERRAASKRLDGKSVIGAVGARETLLDVLAILRSGPQAWRLRGLHSVVAPRPYGVRKATFELVARRLKRRHGWRIGPSRVERVWKEWCRRQRLESTSIL